MSGRTPLITRNGSSIASRTFAQLCHRLPISYNGTLHSHPKLPLPVGQSPTQSTCLILGHSRPTIPNGIQIQSAIFPQTDIHRPTDGLGDITCTNTRLYALLLIVSNAAKRAEATRNAWQSLGCSPHGITVSSLENGSETKLNTELLIAPQN